MVESKVLTRDKRGNRANRRDSWFEDEKEQVARVEKDDSRFKAGCRYDAGCAQPRIAIIARNCIEIARRGFIKRSSYHKQSLNVEPERDVEMPRFKNIGEHFVTRTARVSISRV